MATSQESWVPPLSVDRGWLVLEVGAIAFLLPSWGDSLVSDPCSSVRQEAGCASPLL